MNPCWTELIRLSFISAVVVGPTPPQKKWWRNPTTISTHTGRWYPHLAGIRSRWYPPSSQHPGPLVDWCHPPFNNRCPTYTGSVHKSVTFRCGSDLQRGHSGDGCLSSSILFKYECSMGHLFLLSWARV